MAKLFSLGYLGPIFISFLVFVIYNTFAPPPNNGVLNLNAAGYGNITIYKDKDGISRIYADTFKDALFAQGYVHAQDRLWSLQVKRYLSQGRLSELFGSKTLPIDKFFRTVGIAEAGRDSAPHLDAIMMETTQAYADGINSYVSTMKYHPLEFWMLWSTFENFTVTDSVTILKFLCFTTSMDWITELIRTRLAEEVGREKTLEWLRVDNLFEETLIINDEELKTTRLFDPKLGEKLKKMNFSDSRDTFYKRFHNDSETYRKNAVFRKGGIDELIWKHVVDEFVSFRGSNAWVIHGNLTNTGKPIVCNDPHQPSGIPSVWHLTEMNFENLTLFGAGFPGIPSTIFGRTQNIAWGITTLIGDNADLFEEQISEDGTKYLYEGKWYPLDVREELIKVRFDVDIKYKVYSTRHGPIINRYTADDLPFLVFPRLTEKNISLAWAGRIKEDPTYRGFRDMFYATTTQEAVKAIQSTCFNGNFLFGLANGDIGFATGGRYVKRTHYENEPFFKNGSLAEDDWFEMIPPNEMPAIINPPKGYILHANNKIASNNLKHGMSVNIGTQSRAYRATQIIEKWKKEGHKITLEDARNMQLDVVDPYLEEVIGGLLALVEKYAGIFKDVDRNAISEMVALMANWNATFEKESTPALIWSVWELLYQGKLLQKFPHFDQYERLQYTAGWFAEQYQFSQYRSWIRNETIQNDPLYCQDVNNSYPEPACIYHLVHALAETPKYIEKELGANRTLWQWGTLHTAEFPHLPFSMIPGIRWLYHRSYPANGNRRTLDFAGYEPQKHSFKAIHTANYRVAMSLAEKTQYHMLDTGNTESPFSKHYDDQLQLFRNGKYYEFDIDKETIDPQWSKLTLVTKKKNA